MKASLGRSSLHLRLDEAGLGGVLLPLRHGAHPGQELAASQTQLNVLSQLVGGLQVVVRSNLD